MFNAITHSAVWVNDQDEALDFYVGKLGLEVAADVDLGQNMRWLTVKVPGDEREVLLESTDAFWLDEESKAALKEIVSKGMTGLNFNLRTDDCHATYEDLVAKDVEITEEPVERFYGIDCGIRDPFGNKIRITQPIEGGAPPQA